ncbi:Hypothetical protein SMAX5B_007628 [Scophthalmus maximus]|uniref:Uncharacterized protein n=1 Tax=Scophthalmus maximus TaxID=52904 RepID=A0A2U9CK57_SCOMX|nr:Hypothetical protein SMAX5B_007628 [Scophthalmus maximus]
MANFLFGRREHEPGSSTGSDVHPPEFLKTLCHTLEEEFRTISEATFAFSHTAPPEKSCKKSGLQCQSENKLVSE